MIETLQGIRETVHFMDDSTILLYNNDEYENYPIHWHTAIEIIMPLKNTYTVYANDIPYHLKEGEILLIAPGVLHQLFAPAEGSRLIFQADISLLNNLKGFSSTLSLLQPVVLITKDNSYDIHDKLHQIMLDIMDEYYSNNTIIEAAIYAKLLDFYVLLGREYTNNKDKFIDVKNTKQQEYLEKFISVCDYINNHCTDNLTLDDVASLAGFSKFHFSRLFKQFTNISFYKYLNQQRISYAEKLLIDPNISITEAATRSGFNSHATFNRMFKSFKNCTPTEFKNLRDNKKMETLSSRPIQ